MDMDKIGQALMLCVDTLGYEHEGVIMIDESENDDSIKAGLKKCIASLEEQNKTAVVSQIKELTKGWM